MNYYFYLKSYVKRIVLTAGIFFLSTTYAQSQPCDPANIITISNCGDSHTFTLSGAGVWTNQFCNFSVPGAEQIFSFTPTVSGIHDLIITNGSGFIDYGWKDASLGCDEFNWACIADVSSSATVSFGPLTAGVTYLILADNESATTARTHTISIGCPPPPATNPCDPASIITINSCGDQHTFTLIGTGLWTNQFCNFSVPGAEQIFSFTPTQTGFYNLVVTNGTDWIDYAWKEANLGCDEFNWNCIDDIFSSGNVSFGVPFTSGVTYYILADAEQTTSTTHTLEISCAPPPPPACPLTAVAPYSQDFDAIPSGESGLLTNGWYSSPTSGYLWQSDAAGTGTSNTGPTVDHTLGNSSGIYMYTESTSGSTGHVAFLESPCIDLGTLSNPALSFWYHLMFNGDGAVTPHELHLDISTDQGTTWTNDIIPPFIGEQQANQTDPWLQSIVSLSAYSGMEVKFRFRAIRGSDGFGDMAIDDFSVYNQPAVDLALTNLFAPASGDCALNASTPIEITIKNNGFATLDFSTDPVNFTADISGPVNSTIAYTHNTGSIAPGASLNIVIGSADISVNGTYLIDLALSATVDLNTSNDSLSTSIDRLILTAPFVDNFDSNSNSQFDDFANGWMSNPISGYRWQASSSSSGNSSGTGPGTALGDHTSGSGIYMFTEGSNGGAGDIAEFISPCIDLSTLTNPGLRYWYHMFGVIMGELHVDISTDNGATWINDITPALIGQQQLENDPWLERIVNLSAFAGQTVKIRFRGISGGNWETDMSIDDVEVFDIPNVDLGITALASPTESCGLTATTPIEVTIKNTGALDYDFSVNPATITATITGPVNTNINYVHNTGTLSSFSSMNVVIGNADLSANGTYNIDITINATGDGDLTNDNLVTDITNNTFISPHIENFETFTGSTNATGLTNGWTTNPAGPTTSDFRWNPDAGGTPTGSSTGPGVDHTLGTTAGMYMFTEASSGSSGDVAELYSPCINLGSLTNPTLSFWFHMWGSAMGELHVDLFVNGTWTLDVTAPLIGQQQSNKTDAWIERQVPLTAYAGQQILIRFRAIHGGGIGGDMAIDDFKIFNPTPVDIGIANLVSPVSYSCGFTSADPVVVTLRNDGTSPHDFSTDPATISATITGPVNTNLNFVHNTGTLAVGSSVNVTIGNADFSQGGDYNVDLNSSVAADGNTLNDNLTKIVTVVAAPHLETFETFTSSTNATGLTNGWTTIPSATTSSFRWNPDAGGTPTGSTTGPGVDHTLGTSSGIYMFTESTSGSTGAIAELQSPCISLGTLSNPTLSFWYHMWGSNMGELHVDVNAGGVWNIDVMPPLVGQQQAAKADPWLEMVIPLSAYVGQDVIVRFRAIRGGGSAGDMAVDDVSIFNQSTIDLGVTDLVNPQSFGCDFGAVAPVEVTIVNSGLNVHDFSTDPATITATITGPVNSNIVYVHNTGTLASSTSLNIVIGNGDFSLSGTYTVDLNVSVAGDGTAINDNYSENVTSIAAPFLDTFDANANAQSDAFANGWQSSPTTGFRWEASSSSDGNSTGTGPGTALGDHTSGSGIYMFTEATSGSTGAVAELISPCIDLSSLTAPALRFWYHMFGPTMGELHLDISTDNGATWITDIMSPIIGEQHQELDPWTEVIVPLTAYSGQSVRFKFRGIRGSSFTSDMSIDDFEIYNLPAVDLGITALASPSEACGLSASTPIELTIINTGGDPYDFSVNPASFTAVVTGPVNSNINYVHNTGTLASFASMNIVIGTADLSLNGTYVLDFNVTAPGDANVANDNFSTSIDNNTTNSPYLEDFETFTNSTNATGLTNGWTTVPSGTTGSYRWNPDTGGTPTGTTTGPGVDHTLGTTSGRYMFTEASSGSTGDVAELYSPCVNLAGLANPSLSFWYHMWGADMGELHVDISSNGVWDMDVTAPLIGQQQAAKTDPWLRRTVSLASYAGQQIIVRFRGIKGGGITGDMAIDDFRIFDQPAADLGVTALVSPVSESCDFTASTPIEITVFNNGLDPYDFSSDPASFTAVITGPINSNINYVHSTGTLASLTAMNIIIGNADLSASGTYNIDVTVAAIGDANTANDNLIANVTNSTITVFPHLEDFESFTETTNATGLENGWTTDPSGTTGAFRWNPNAGGTTSSGTGPTVDHTLGTSAGIYMYTEATNGSTGDEAFLISPCLDFSSLSAPAMDFWYHMFGDDMEGGLHVDVYSGGVWNLDVMTPIVGQQQLQADPYLMQTVLLDAYAGERIQIRFRAIKGGSFEGDMAIDDINLYQQPPCDPLTLSAGTATISNEEGCGGDSVDLTLDGHSTGLGLTIQWEVSTDGGATFTPIAGADNSSYNTGPLSGSGTHIYQAVVTCSPNSATSNSVSVSITDPQITSTVADTVCGIGEVTLSATASEGDVFWYDDANSHTPIDTGSVLTTTINTTTTFYAAAGTGGSTTVGAPDPSISGSLDDQTGLTPGINFDVLAAGGLTISSVDIFPTDPVGTNYVIEVLQGSTVIASYAGFTTVSGSTSNPIGETVPVNLVIPAGSGYTMEFDVNNPNSIRNDGGDAFPYTIPGVISLTSSTLSGFYYFFYNWVISTGCTSDKVPVTAVSTPAPAVEISGASQICEGASATLDLISGKAEYTTFEWSPSIGLSDTTGSTVIASPTTTTTYVVLASGNPDGCQNADTFTVNVINFELEAVTDKYVSCGGAPVQLNTVVSAQTLPTTSFANADTIFVPGTGTGATTGEPANPYPSVINVSGLPVNATFKSVTLKGLHHTFADDIDIALVSPTNEVVILMSDIGGGFDLTGEIYTFSTDATSTMADVTAGNPSGIYLPSNVGINDDFPAPGPGDNFDQADPTLSSFVGDPNGNWSLYVVDDGSGDVGIISDGWELEFVDPSSVSYSWSPSTGLSSTTIANPTSLPPTAGSSITYTVLATESISGCTASSEITIFSEDPQVVSSTGDTRCGLGEVNLSATGQTGELIVWWDDALASQPIHVGNNFDPFIINTTTYHVSSISPALSTTISTGFGANLDGTITGATAGGNMFDIVAQEDLIIHSLDVHLNDNLAASDISVYFKEGSYTEAEFDASAWTLAGSVSGVVSSGIGTPTPLPLDLNLKILQGQTYGIYIIVTNLGVGNPLRYNNSATSPDLGTLAAGDTYLQVLTGTATYGPFTTGVITPDNRMWNGNVHYSIICESARVPVTAIIEESPVVEVSGGPVVCGNESVTLNVTTGASDYTNFDWSPADGLNTTSGTSVIASPTQTTTYVVFASGNPLGCQATDTIQLIVVDPPQINITSTNGEFFCDIANTVLSSNVGLSGIYSNSSSITINETDEASPYPSKVSVAGIPAGGTVAKVKMFGITHTAASEMDVVLVSPTNHAVLLFADRGGLVAFDPPGVAELTLIDGGATFPTGSLSAPFEYAPGLGTWSGGPIPDVITAMGSTLSSFTGDLNGEWKLYIYDDGTGDPGVVAGGWSIEFSGLLPPSVSWSPVTGLSDPNIADPTATPSSTTTYTATVTDPNTGCISQDSITITVEPVPEPVIASTDSVICADEFAVLSTQYSDSTGYTHLWNTDANGNNPQSTDPFFNVGSAGAGFANTVIVISANGCTSLVSEPYIVSTISYILNESSIVIQPASCVDGYIEFILEGFLLPSFTPVSSGYWYSVDGSPYAPAPTGSTAGSIQIPLSGGLHNISVLDTISGCVFIVAEGYDHPQYDPLDLQLDSVAPASCFGVDDGFASVTPSGGSGSYTVTWLTPTPKSGETNSDLPGGDVTVEVVDNETGCTYSIVVSVPQPDLLVVDIGSDMVIPWGTTKDYTADGCTDLSAATTGGTAPYSYLWSTGDTINPLLNICYAKDTVIIFTVTVTDVNGCTATATATYTWTNIDCSNNSNGTKVQICFVPPGDPGNCQTICVAVSSAQAIFDNTSSYLGSCQATCPTARVTAIETGETLNVHLFPNPTSDKVTVNYMSDNTHVTSIVVMDIQGRVLQTLHVANELEFAREVDLGTLENGLYMINIMSDQKLISSSRVVKTQ